MNEPKTARKTTRDASKESRRLALIEATADTILEHGLLGVSVSRILERVGLSRGMINLHFATKNNLLTSVAEHYWTSYTAHWHHALDNAGTQPEARLRAIIDADFDPVVLNRRSMAVWFAFRGEARSSPEFMAFIDSRDPKMLSALHEICVALCAAGPYPEVDAQLVVLALNAALEGLWTDFHLHPDQFDGSEARAVMLHMARAFFPNHFGAAALRVAKRQHSGAN